MFLEKLYLRKIRNIKEAALSLNSRTNVIIGENAAGKTTILESIDVFINDKLAVSKYEKADINNKGGNESKIGL